MSGKDALLEPDLPGHTASLEAGFALYAADGVLEGGGRYVRQIEGLLDATQGDAARLLATLEDDAMAMGARQLDLACPPGTAGAIGEQAQKAGYTLAEGAEGGVSTLSKTGLPELKLMTRGLAADEAAKVQKWIAKIDNSQNMYLAVHGQGNTFKVLHGGVEATLDHRALARWIEKQGGLKPGQQVVLLSCADASTGQHLANRLGRKVVVWEGATTVFEDGTILGQGACHRYSPGNKAEVLTGSNIPSGKGTPSPAGQRVVLGTTRQANWVEVLDIAAKVEAKRTHVLRLDVNTNATGFKGCHSKIALDKYVEAHPGTRYTFRDKVLDASGNGVYEAKPVVVRADGVEMLKTNNQGKSTFFPR